MKINGYPRGIISSCEEILLNSQTNPDNKKQVSHEQEITASTNDLLRKSELPPISIQNYLLHRSDLGIINLMK